ncbi:MAG: TonB-dependent receptor [Bacteroides sp.]|nr:TonB-dependent receptor [Bacteroides sp.]
MKKQKAFHGQRGGDNCRLYLILFSLFLFLLIPLRSYGDEATSVEAVQQNSVKVTGTVVDTNGEPVIGANVMVDGSTIGTITDINGKFTLNVPKDGVKLRISFIGYKEQIVAAKKSISLHIVMEDDAQQLGEVQVVAYGVQKKVSITGAISSMKGDDLLKTPAGSLSNILSGQITGISSVQYSGEPGADAAELFVRGKATWDNANPLIQVDGVERDFSQIDPNEVESITVLKDASATAVFGVRGANGVILITTKRGSEGKAKISFSTSAGVNVRTKELEFANSYQYASYYNDMMVNDGGVPTFNETQLEKFRTHSDPILYPDMNWIDYCMDKAAFQSQHNLNISGGTDNMRYFVSAGMFTQGGMFKQFNAADDFNFDYKRYNYRANLDFDVTKTTLLSVNIGGRIESKRTPESGEDQNQLFRKLYWAVPFAGAGIVDGRRIVSNGDYLPFTGTDGLASYYGRGFRSTTTNVLNLDLALNQKLDVITKGLSLKLKGAYNSEYSNKKIASSSKASYTPVVDSDGSLVYRKDGTDSQLSYSEPDDQFGKARDWYMELALTYNRKFGDHNVSGLFLYNQSKRYYPAKYSDIPSGYVGLVGRATYDWKTRYMAEFNVGYNGSENFAPGMRYGLFPAGSLGWVVSEESFFRPVKKVLSYFKLRASVGMVGNDNGGGNRFLYIPDSYIYSGDGGYFFGTNVGNKKPGAYESSKSYRDVTWETAVKQNYGVDATFFGDRFNVSVDYFIEKRKDILSTPDYLPGILGMSLPTVNIGKTENKGFELLFKWSDKLKNDFRYWANLNLSFARNKIIFKNEVDQNEPWMYETGRQIGSRSMYKFWGFYDETADLRYQNEFGRSIADHGITLVPGDCVYVDLNNDGNLNGDDATRNMGFTDTPEYTAGLNLGFNWKNFDFSMQWTGAWNVDRMLSEFRRPLGDTNNKGLLLYQYETTWRSSADTYTAKYPRASSGHAANNYNLSSDLYLINASYLRLKNVEIGYNFQFPFMKKLKLNDFRMYANGYNLLTFSGFKWGDPESRQSDRPNYPLTRVFNIGLKLGF